MSELSLNDLTKTVKKLQSSEKPKTFLIVDDKQLEQIKRLPEFHEGTRQPALGYLYQENLLSLMVIHKDDCIIAF